MAIFEIYYIDTVKLESYIRETIRRWKHYTVWDSVKIYSRHVWRDEFSTKAVFFCLFNPNHRFSGPYLMIYIEYDEVELTGRVELEYSGLRVLSSSSNFEEILKDVFSTYDPSKPTLQTKCPHCNAKYMYKKQVGIVTCQNCDNPFDLEYSKDNPTTEFNEVG